MIKEILKSNNPAELIRANKQDIFKIIPDLKACDMFEQRNDYHIYDVFEHTLHVLDEVDNNYILRIAALFHDIGKPSCLVIDEDGVGHFYGHWNISSLIFNKYAHLFDLSDDEINLIKDLILYHDLDMNARNIDQFKEIFKDNIGLLMSLKRADILAQNPKYNYRIDNLDNINKQYIGINKSA